MNFRVFGLVATGMLLAACSSEPPAKEEVIFTPQKQFNAPGSVADLKATAGDRVFFGFDKYVIEDLESIRRIAKWIAKYNKSVTIVGHCDERGTVAYNDLLGQRRAKAAANALLNALKAEGCTNASLVTKVVSAGKRYLIVQGNTEADHAKNRVSIFVLNHPAAPCGSEPVCDTGASPAAPVDGASPAAPVDGAAPVDSSDAQREDVPAEVPSDSSSEGIPVM